MWFAALGSYQHNPWLVHLVYRLLIGQEEGMSVDFIAYHRWQMTSLQTNDTVGCHEFTKVLDQQNCIF
jgi:hypothetical protein